MATVQITIPDALVPRLKAAMRGTFPQHDALGDVAAFKEITADYWRQVLLGWETQEASRVAREAAELLAAQDGAGIV